MLKSLFLLLVILWATACSAVELQITITGVGSGTIGNINFPESPFTIKALANTDYRYPFPGVSGYYWIDHDPARVTIDNVGTYQFLSSTRTYVYKNEAKIGFARGGETGADLYVGYEGDFSAWDLQSPIGPVSLTGTIFEWANTRKYNTPIQTDGGVLIFNDSTSSPETFTATIVPEPSTLALLTLGAVGLLAARRR